MNSSNKLNREGITSGEGGGIKEKGERLLRTRGSS